MCAPNARLQCIAKYGTECFICKFSFKTKYGKTADGFIHVHHLLRLSNIRKEHKVDPVKDLRPERPHEALAMQCPAEVYKASTRQYRGLGELSYPFHDRTALVTYCGRICIFRKKINLSTSLAGQAVGIKEVDDGIWLVTFMDYDLGYIDLDEKTLQPLNNPFGPGV